MFFSNKLEILIESGALLQYFAKVNYSKFSEKIKNLNFIIISGRLDRDIVVSVICLKIVIEEIESKCSK